MAHSNHKQFKVTAQRLAAMTDDLLAGKTLGSCCNKQGFAYISYYRDRRKVEEIAEADRKPEEQRRYRLYQDHREAMDNYDRELVDSLPKRLMQAYQEHGDWRAMDKAGEWASRSMELRNKSKRDEKPQINITVTSSG